MAGLVLEAVLRWGRCTSDDNTGQSSGVSILMIDILQVFINNQLRYERDVKHGVVYHDERDVAYCIHNYVKLSYSEV